MSYKQLWDQTLELIGQSNSLSPDALSQWIIPNSELIKIDDNVFIIACSNVVAMSVLKQSTDLLVSTLKEVTGIDAKIQLIKKSEASQYLLDDAPVQPTYSIEVKSDPFTEIYTFENFVQGVSNAEAYAACMQCCNERNKHMFNPIMLFGNSGLGKTHLLHAIGNYLKKERPECKIYYAYAGKLVDLLLDAMRSSNIHGNNVEEVKRQLSQFDYFLIDDIQNLKQSSSQEVFFSVYNDLIQRNAQIVITSDMHPNELIGIQDRLISRFNQGLKVNISKPEFDTSKAILKKKLEGHEETCMISDDVLDYLANKFSDDVRNLEGSLNKLIFNATLENPDVIDMDFAQRILMKEPIVINQDELTIKQIKKAVVRFYGLTYKDLEGKSRQKNIMNARHVFVYLSREYLHKAYVSIGQELGNRDHTTISSSYERARQLLEKDKAFILAIDKVKDMLNIQ